MTRSLGSVVTVVRKRLLRFRFRSKNFLVTTTRPVPVQLRPVALLPPVVVLQLRPVALRMSFEFLVPRSESHQSSEHEEREADIGI
jgi:hypothetical protein